MVRLIQVATPYWPDAASWITHFQASENGVSVPAAGDGRKKLSPIRVNARPPRDAS